MARTLKEHCHLYMFVPTLLIDQWIKIIRKYLTFMNLIATRAFVNNRFQIKNNFCYDAQYIIFASKGQSKNMNEVDWIPTSTVWLNDKRNTNPKLYTYLYPSFINDDIIHANTKANDQVKQLHPNEKNPLLIQKFIEMSTNKGDLVADFFGGSGGTLIASLNAGRSCIGIEKNKGYYDLIRGRLDKYKKEQEYLERNTLKACLIRLANKKKMKQQKVNKMVETERKWLIRVKYPFEKVVKNENGMLDSIEQYYILIDNNREIRYRMKVPFDKTKEQEFHQDGKTKNHQ